MGEGAAAPDLEVYRREMVDQLHRALKKLPKRCREAYTLRWMHHMSHAEVARVMGVSVKAVEAQMARAIGILRTELSGFQSET